MPIRLTELVTRAVTNCPEAYAALSSIDPDSYVFETLPTQSDDGEVKDLNLLHVGSTATLRNPTKVWAHATGDAVTYFHQLVNDPAGTPLHPFGGRASQHVRFIFPFNKIHPPSLAGGGSIRATSRYRKQLLICYIFMIRGKLEEINTLKIENISTGASNSFAHGKVRIDAGLQFERLCLDFLREKDNEDSIVPRAPSEAKKKASAKAAPTKQAKASSKETSGFASSNHVIRSNKAQSPEAVDSDNSAAKPKSASDHMRGNKPDARGGQPTGGSKRPREDDDRDAPEKVTAKRIKKTVSKDNATQYQPSQDSKRISASTSIGGASNAAAGFHSLTGSIHEYADHIHDTCRHLEAELAAEQRRNEVLGQQADILKREYKDKYQDSQSTLMDLQVKHENLTEQYKSEVLDLELELVEAKQKIAELRASPSEQAKKHKDELDELRKRLQAETQRADAAENEAEKFKAKYADLKKNVFSFITDDE